MSLIALSLPVFTFLRQLKLWVQATWELVEGELPVSIEICGGDQSIRAQAPQNWADVFVFRAAEGLETMES